MAQNMPINESKTESKAAVVAAMLGILSGGASAAEHGSLNFPAQPTAISGPLEPGSINIARVQELHSNVAFVNSVDEVIAKKKDNPECQLFLQGELRSLYMSQEAISNLALLLEKHPNYVVYITSKSLGARYNDGKTTFQDWEAVEAQLSRELTNFTSFGKTTHPDTGKKNGALIALTYEQGKIFFHGLEQYEDEGLGNANWTGNLDRLALKHLKPNRNTEQAIASTINGIEEKLESNLYWQRNALPFSMAGLGALGAAGLGLVILRRRSTKKSAEELVQDWEEKLSKRLDLLTRMEVDQIHLLGLPSDPRKYTGDTLKIVNAATERFDALHNMYQCAEKALSKAKDMLRDDSSWISSKTFKAVREHLQKNTLEFDPESHLEEDVKEIENRQLTYAEHLKQKKFKMTFEELISTFDSEFTELQQNLVELKKVDDNVVRSVNAVELRFSLFKAELDAQIEEAKEQEDLNKPNRFILPLIPEVLVPGVQKQLQEANELQLSDPVQAYNQAHALDERLAEIENLLKQVEECSSKILPKIEANEKLLAQQHINPNWVDQALAAVREATNEKLRQYARNPLNPLKLNLQSELEQIQTATNDAVRVEKLLREGLEPDYNRVYDFVVATRTAIAKKLELDESQVLHERDADPDTFLGQAEDAHAQIRELLSSGKIASTTQLLKAAETAVDTARDITEDTKRAFEAFETRSAQAEERSQELDSQLKGKEGYRSILKSLKNQFAKEALSIKGNAQAADQGPGITADLSISNNIDEVEQAQEIRRSAQERSLSFYKAGKIIASEIELEQVEKLNAFIAERFAEIENRKAELYELVDQNTAGIKQVWDRVQEYSNLVEDRIIQDSTIQMLSESVLKTLGAARDGHLSKEALERGRVLSDNREYNPAKVQEALQKAQNALTEFERAVAADRRNHSEAGELIRLANAELSLTARANMSTEHDNRPDSEEVLEARSKFVKLNTELAKLERQYSRPKQNWQAIEDEAERIQKDSRKLAEIFRREVRRAEDLDKRFTEVKELMRSANDWRGSYVSGIPTSDSSQLLRRARSEYQSGDYEDAIQLLNMAEKRLKADIKEAKEQEQSAAREAQRAAAEAARLAEQAARVIFDSVRKPDRAPSDYSAPSYSPRRPSAPASSPAPSKPSRSTGFGGGGSGIQSSDF